MQTNNISGCFEENDHFNLGVHLSPISKKGKIWKGRKEKESCLQGLEWHECILDKEGWRLIKKSGGVDE